MNINMHNTISMMSSMVGIPHNSARKVNNEKSEGDRVKSGNLPDETSESEESKVNHKASGAAASGKAASLAKGDNKHQVNNLSRRVVAEENQKPAEDGAKAEHSSLAAKGGSPKPAQKSSSLFYDTSRLIQHNFKNTQEAQPDPQKLRPDVQRKQFAENLKKWVQLEYNQFTKNAEPLYTRRNLREILSALGDSDSKTQKSGSKEDSTGKSQVGLSKFYKYNISQASNALKLFEEMSMPEPPQHFGDMDLVA